MGRLRHRPLHVELEDTLRPGRPELSVSGTGRVWFTGTGEAGILPAPTTQYGLQYAYFPLDM